MRANAPQLPRGGGGNGRSWNWLVHNFLSSLFRKLDNGAILYQKLFFGLFRNSLNCDSPRWSHIHFICISAVHTISFCIKNYVGSVTYLYRNVEFSTRHVLFCMVWRIRFNTSTPSESTVAPKSNLIRLGSAHEWSGVWIGPISPQSEEKDEWKKRVVEIFLCRLLSKEHVGIEWLDLTNKLCAPCPHFESLLGPVRVFPQCKGLTKIK